MKSVFFPISYSLVPNNSHLSQILCGQKYPKAIVPRVEVKILCKQYVLHSCDKQPPHAALAMAEI